MLQFTFDFRLILILPTIRLIHNFLCLVLIAKLARPPGGGGALGYFLGGYVPPGTPNWHPVLEKISTKIDTPF